MNTFSKESVNKMDHLKSQEKLETFSKKSKTSSSNYESDKNLQKFSVSMEEYSDFIKLTDILSKFDDMEEYMNSQMNDGTRHDGSKT